MQMLRSGSRRIRSGSGGFWCGAHTQVRFRKVPVQRLGEVPEGSERIPRSGSGKGSGADAEVRFWKVPMQMLR